MPQHPGGNDIWSVDELSSFRFGKPEDVRRIEREQQELRWATEGRSQFDGEDMTVVTGGRAPDQDYIRECIRANEATLQEMRPPQELTAIQMNKYARLHEDLEKEFTSYMPSKEQMEDPSDSNVELNMAWQEHQGRKAIAWMNCRQILDATNDNPFFTSVESIRPATPPKNDPRKIRENWGLLRFTNAQERRAVTIDDPTYQQFLLYRALDWSDLAIKKALGFSAPQFEAALDRMQGDADLHRDLHAEVSVLTPAETVDMLAHLPGPDRGKWMNQQLNDRMLNSQAVARDLKMQVSIWQDYMHSRRTMPENLFKKCRLWLERYDDKPEVYASFLRAKAWAVPDAPPAPTPRHSDDELADPIVKAAAAAGYEAAQ